jgi:hypothetical protein
VEEWYCPACGRRILVQWPPAYKLIVLAAGDEEIRHNVSKGNSRNGSCPVKQREATDLIDEIRLLPWIKWMEKVDFEGKWGKEVLPGCQMNSCLGRKRRKENSENNFLPSFHDYQS